MSETKGRILDQSTRYFKVQRSDHADPIFGEALAFFEMLETKQLLVVYHLIGNCMKVLKNWRGVWIDRIEVMLASAIHCVVSIWSYRKSPWVYILRKHPGLPFLSDHEAGRRSEDGEEEEEEEEQ